MHRRTSACRSFRRTTYCTASNHQHNVDPLSFFRAVFRLHDPKVLSLYGTCGCHHRGGRRLMGTGCSHRASASSSGSSGAGPTTHDSLPTGSSRRELAAGTTGAARLPAPRVEAGRAWTQRVATPEYGKSRRPLLRSGRRLPRQPRRARSGGRARAQGKSGGACGMRRRRPGSVSAPGRASPEPVTGETMVASTASCAPCGCGPVGDDLDPALILDQDVQVHVRQALRTTWALASWQTRHAQAEARARPGPRMLHSGGRRAHQGARGSGMPEAQAAGAGASGARGGHGTGSPGC